MEQEFERVCKKMNEEVSSVAHFLPTLLNEYVDPEKILEVLEQDFGGEGNAEGRRDPKKKQNALFSESKSKSLNALSNVVHGLRSRRATL